MSSFSSKYSMNQAHAHARPHSTDAHKHTHTRAHTPTHTRRADILYRAVDRKPEFKSHWDASGYSQRRLPHNSSSTRTGTSSSLSTQRASLGSLSQSSPSQGGHPCLHLYDNVVVIIALVVAVSRTVQATPPPPISRGSSGLTPGVGIPPLLADRGSSGNSHHDLLLF